MSDLFVGYTLFAEFLLERINNEFSLRHGIDW
jgi:hypothetical protein